MLKSQKSVLTVTGYIALHTFFFAQKKSYIDYKIHIHDCISWHATLIVVEFYFPREYNKIVQSRVQSSSHQPKQITSILHRVSKIFADRFVIIQTETMPAVVTLLVHYD